MERHSVDAGTAFEMLRDHARDANRKLVDVAAAVATATACYPSSPGSPDTHGERRGSGVRREALDHRDRSRGVLELGVVAQAVQTRQRHVRPELDTHLLCAGRGAN